MQLQPISLQQMQQRRACQSVSSDVCIAALSGGLHRQQRQQPQRRKRLGWSIHQPTELRLVAREAPSAPHPIAPPSPTLAPLCRGPHGTGSHCANLPGSSVPLTVRLRLPPRSVAAVRKKFHRRVDRHAIGLLRCRGACVKLRIVRVRITDARWTSRRGLSRYRSVVVSPARRNCRFTCIEITRQLVSAWRVRPATVCRYS